MTKSKTPEASPLFVSALARGISILVAFSERSPEMTLPELAQATLLTKSSVQRFAHTLWTLGYLRKNPINKKFSLAPASLELGTKYAQTSKLVIGSNAFLHSLNRATQETCSLSEPVGLQMVYVSRFATHKQMFVNMPIGTRIPLYCAAAGRAVLCGLQTDIAKTIIESCERSNYTSSTLTTVEDVMNEIAFAKQHGFARSNGEYYPGDITISAPIVDAAGVPVAAVSVSVPSSRWSFDDAQNEFGPQVIETARAINSAVSLGVTQPFYVTN